MANNNSCLILGSGIGRFCLTVFGWTMFAVGNLLPIGLTKLAILSVARMLPNGLCGSYVSVHGTLAVCWAFRPT